MSIYVYAICRSDAAAPAQQRGLRSGALRMVRAGGLAALVGDVAGGDAAPDGPLGTEDDLWRHEQAVEALMARHDVLPARFGTVVASEQEARALLRRRAAEFEDALARVAGSVEVGVRAALAPEPAEPAEPPERTHEGETGTGYMLAAKRREQRVAELQERIARALRPLARSSLVGASRGAQATIASAHLVERERLGEFRERAQRLAEEIDGASLVCTGPWPPYSFVAAREEDLR